MPGVASDLPRLLAVAGRRTVTSVAGRAPRTIEPLPSTIAAEMRKANEALASSRRLRRYAERWIYEHNARLTAGFIGCEGAASGGRRLPKVVILKQPSDLWEMAPAVTSNSPVSTRFARRSGRL
jgi:hypothetical protein